MIKYYFCGELCEVTRGGCLHVAQKTDANPKVLVALKKLKSTSEFKSTNNTFIYVFLFLLTNLTLNL